MWLIKSVLTLSLVAVLFSAGYWTRHRVQPIYQAVEQLAEAKQKAASLLPW